MLLPLTFGWLLSLLFWFRVGLDKTFHLSGRKITAEIWLKDNRGYYFSISWIKLCYLYWLFLCVKTFSLTLPTFSSLSKWQSKQQMNLYVSAYLFELSSLFCVSMCLWASDALFVVIRVWRLWAVPWRRVSWDWASGHCEWLASSEPSPVSGPRTTVWEVGQIFMYIHTCIHTVHTLIPEEM